MASSWANAETTCAKEDEVLHSRLDAVYSRYSVELSTNLTSPRGGGNRTTRATDILRCIILRISRAFSNNLRKMDRNQQQEGPVLSRHLLVGKRSEAKRIPGDAIRLVLLLDAYGEVVLILEASYP